MDPAEPGLVPDNPATESVSVPELPDVLKRYLDKLEDWALRNQNDAKWDALKFWALRIPAILVSASSGFLASFSIWAAKFAGVVASVCVVLDGLLHLGPLRAVHLRAVAELRTLQNDIYAQWAAGSLRKKQPNQLAAEIIENSEKEKKRIAAYVQAAETAVPAVTGANFGPHHKRWPTQDHLAEGVRGYIGVPSVPHLRGRVALRPVRFMVTPHHHCNFSMSST